MQTYMRAGRAVAAGIGFATMIAACPTIADARAAGHAAPAAHPSTRLPVRLVSFSSSYSEHAKKSYTMGLRQLSLQGTRISLHDGVYYHGASKFALNKNGKARYTMHGRGMRYGYAFGGGEGSLQCVPFARAASGIELKGNAANWWDAAAGVYERGSRPEPGSVLNFRATGHMRLGHVAVVSNVVSPREIEIDHANWAGAGAYKGGVARGVHVVDVSSDNDWSEVRVALGNGDYGSNYPTYGFIYDRPDDGTMYAGTRHVGFHTASEVAEAPRR